MKRFGVIMKSKIKDTKKSIKLSKNNLNNPKYLTNEINRMKEQLRIKELQDEYLKLYLLTHDENEKSSK